jgi:hypothetical protein
VTPLSLLTEHSSRSVSLSPTYSTANDGKLESWAIGVRACLDMTANLNTIGVRACLDGRRLPDAEAKPRPNDVIIIMVMAERAPAPRARATAAHGWAAAAAAPRRQSGA